MVGNLPRLDLLATHPTPLAQDDGSLPLMSSEALLSSEVTRLRGGGGISGDAIADLGISVAVLFAVALAARSGSHFMAAVFSTAPTGVPLSLWLVHRAASAAGSTLSIDAFLCAVIKGAIALAAFAVGALTYLRYSNDASPSLLALLSVGFGSWALVWALLRRV